MDVCEACPNHVAVDERGDATSGRDLHRDPVSTLASLAFRGPVRTSEDYRCPLHFAHLQCSTDKKSLQAVGTVTGHRLGGLHSRVRGFRHG